MFNKLGLQIYSVRNYMTDAESIRRTFERLAAIGYSEVQTAGKPNCTTEEYAAAAHDNGFDIIGTHYAFPQDVDNIDDYIEMHRILKTTNAGIGGAHDFAKDKAQFIQFIEKANRLAENLSKHGMKFTYHHHAFEFAKLGGERIMDILVDGLDPKNVSFVLDTHWLQRGGVSITEWMEKLAGRCDILHLKDYAVKPGENNGYITECGEGNINFKDIIKLAEQIGVKHLCVEQDVWPAGFDSVDYCLKKSFDYLSQFIDIK